MWTLRRTKIPLGQILIAGTLLVGAIHVAAAAPATRIACGQCEETDRFVRLQSATAENRPTGTRPSTHPFVLSPEDWASILSELRVRRQAEGLFLPVPQEPVLTAFTGEEIGYLSATLSKAFAQAQPNEWVVFGLSRSTPQGMTELTTGGAYVEGPLLHIVLANYRKAVTMPGTRRLLWELPLRPDAGPAYGLVPGNHRRVVQDPNALSGFLSSVPAELTIAYQPLLLREPETASASQKSLPGNPSSAHSSETAFPSLSIEERLRVLKRLHTQGLITDEEYRAKKGQLLERF